VRREPSDGAIDVMIEISVIDRLPASLAESSLDSRAGAGH
jgi:hypothetical protein